MPTQTPMPSRPSPATERRAEARDIYLHEDLGAPGGLRACLRRRNLVPEIEAALASLEAREPAASGT